jgi:tryptophan-rich sensory protein
MTRPRPLPALGGFLALHFVVAAIGGLTTASTVHDWYQTLAKPAFNPPDFLFGPVWTLLYLLTAIAAWRIWRSAHPLRRRALALYATQLLCNFLWSPLFFGLRQPTLALIDIAVMVPIALACLPLFLRIDRVAGWLWLPYVGWISFALVLNSAIVLLN